VPANLILEQVGPKRWVFCISATWGLLSASNALVQSPLGFYVVRFLLGVAEAGFFPGMLLYLTYWFPRTYLARVTANFMVAIPLSAVIGGPLSSVILGMDGVAGLHGWQWLFLTEEQTCVDGWQQLSRVSQNRAAVQLRHGVDLGIAIDFGSLLNARSAGDACANPRRNHPPVDA
jgi:hypothetical protein